MTLLRAWLSLCLLLAASVPAVAQDISSALGRLPVGTVITWYNSDGLYFTHTVRGKDAKGYRLDYCDGRRADCDNPGTYWVDAKGQMLHFIWNDGREVRYRPHNCARTLGACTYTEARKGAAPFERSIVTTRTSKGFSYVESDPATGREVERGDVVVGANGLNVRNWYQNSGERRISLRIVSVTPPD